MSKRATKRPKHEPAATKSPQQALLTQAVACGVVLDGLNIATAPVNTGGQHTICASRQLAPGHVLAQLPQAELLTTERALASPIGELLSRECTVISESQLDNLMIEEDQGTLSDLIEGKVLTARSVLCAFLVAHRFGPTRSADQSKTASDLFLDLYIQSLPGSGHVETPFMWDSAALELQVPELQDTVQEQLPYHTAQFELLTANVQLLNGVKPTWENWMWANSICTSRFCKKTVAQESGSGAYATEGSVESGSDGVLVPIVDMLNHDTGSCNVDYIPPGPEAAAALVASGQTPSETVGVLVLTAPVDVGDELLYCYGEKSNADLIRAYGFAQYDNMYDVVPLLIDLEHVIGDAPETAQLEAFNKATGSTNGQLEVLLTHKEILPQKAVDAAQACFAATLPDDASVEEVDLKAGAIELLHELVIGKIEHLMHIQEESEGGEGLCFGSMEEWEEYAAKVKERTSVVVGARVYSTTAEGCGVAARLSQLLILMGAAHELEAMLEDGDVGDAGPDSGEPNSM